MQTIFSAPSAALRRVTGLSCVHFLAVFCMALVPAAALEPAPDTAAHSLGLGLPIGYGDYLFFSVDLDYCSPALSLPLSPRINARLRSYGPALFRLEHGFLELSILAKSRLPLYRAGDLSLDALLSVGATANLDTRRLALHTEPLLGSGLAAAAGIFFADLPVNLRIYTDGFLFQPVPAIGIRLGTWQLALFAEVNFFTTWAFSRGEIYPYYGIATGWSL